MAKHTANQLINEAPFSESQDKRKVATKQECINELKRIVEAEPEKVITRNYFRCNSNLAESAWNKHFGTFDEFKKQAGITLSRQQHQLERHIAKHASVDHYRAISEEAREYADKYVSKDSKRWKTILLASDLHDEEIDPFTLRVMIDTAQRVQPDVISLVGDVYDLAEFGKYGVDPREWDIVGKMKFAKENILRPLRKAAPKAQMDLIEGNHEARLVKHLAEQTPALRAVLSDLVGLRLVDLFGLSELEMNYVTKSDLSAFTKRDKNDQLAQNYRIYYDTMLAHHFPYAKKFMLPGVNGHHHTHRCETINTIDRGSFEWHQLGGGHKRDASYCDGEKWSNGFMLAHIDTHKRQVAFDYCDTTNEFAVVGGKFYYRDPKNEA